MEVIKLCTIKESENANKFCATNTSYVETEENPQNNGKNKGRL